MSASIAYIESIHVERYVEKLLELNRGNQGWFVEKRVSKLNSKYCRGQGRVTSNWGELNQERYNHFKYEKWQSS